VLTASGRRLPRLLHVALALIIAVEGALNVSRGFSEQHGLLACFGGAEAVGALLFMWPRAMAVGACILVCTFLIAAGFHIAGLAFPSEHLVYAVAILVIGAQRRQPPASEQTAA
jgi:hypothetical protein